MEHWLAIIQENAFINLFYWLLVGHGVADLVLQTRTMSKMKNRHKWAAEVPDDQKQFMPHWLYWLTTHSMIHGAAVYLVTASFMLGLLETVLHGVIDFFKCEKRYGANVDQALHVLCKVIWAGLVSQGLI